MIVKDVKNNTVCMIEPETGIVSLKYKGLQVDFVLPIGSTYRVIRNSTETIIYHRGASDYKIDSSINNK